MVETKMVTTKKVAIIGGGAAGLCTARHLLHGYENVNVDIVIFESRSSIGGTWVYEEIDKNQPGKKVFSSIYSNLKTNLPKEVMMFPDFPYPDTYPSYMHHTDVLKYLQSYCKHFEIQGFVRNNTEVKNVKPLECTSDGFVEWHVQTFDKITEVMSEETFDAVVICNGHYSIPSYPSIEGIDQFGGEVLHSHYYRHPEDFADRVVLLLGCGPSAVDIMAELSNSCNKVYFSHRGNKVPSVLPKNVIEVPTISHVDKDGYFVFEDGLTIKVDVFLPCTGYLIDFPFFSPDVGILVKENKVLDLYKHIFSIKYPSLSFVGLTWQNTPFPAMHQQCQFIAKVITGAIQLPTSGEMLKDTEKERAERINSGKSTKYFHRMGNRQWNYNKELATLAKNDENPPIIENMYKYAMQFRNADYCKYKRMEFQALNNEEFLDITKDENKVLLK